MIQRPVYQPDPGKIAAAIFVLLPSLFYRADINASSAFLRHRPTNREDSEKSSFMLCILGLVSSSSGLSFPLCSFSVYQRSVRPNHIETGTILGTVPGTKVTPAPYRPSGVGVPMREKYCHSSKKKESYLYLVYGRRRIQSKPDQEVSRAGGANVKREDFKGSSAPTVGGVS